MQDAVSSFVRSVVEPVLVLEQQAHMGCRAYERSAGRIDYANGFYRRSLSRSYGVISDLRVPRLRHQRFVSLLLQRYRRRVRQLDEALLLWFLQGESCRDVVRSLLNSLRWNSFTS